MKKTKKKNLIPCPLPFSIHYLLISSDLSTLSPLAVLLFVVFITSSFTTPINRSLQALFSQSTAAIFTPHGDKGYLPQRRARGQRETTHGSRLAKSDGMTHALARSTSVWEGKLIKALKNKSR